MAKTKTKKSYFPSARVHHLTAYVYDTDGHLLFTESKLIEIMKKHEGAYSTYAIILHNKDTYNAEDEYVRQEQNKKVYIERYRILCDAAGIPTDEFEESGYLFNEEIANKAQQYADSNFPLIKEGEPKHHHFHIVLTFPVNRRIDEIARWFNLSPYWDEIKTGRGAAENAWLYLTHEREPKKAQYDRSDVRASFDFISQIESQLAKDEKREKYHMSTDDIREVIESVANGLPISKAIEMVSEAIYIEKKSQFDKAREYYVQNKMPMPFLRQVFYIDSKGLDEKHGQGGIGKSAVAKALCRQLAVERYGNDIHIPFTELDSVYTAGDAKVFLQNYDGEPIVLIDEINGVDFKRACKGVNGVKALLAPFPERKGLDKKHGSVICSAEYIIINGIESFEAFKNSLAGSMLVDGEVQESEESVKEQFDRRFWGNIHIVDKDTIQFFINRGLFENTPEQKYLELCATKRANFQQIASRTSGAAQYQLESKILKPLVDLSLNAHNVHTDSKISCIEELPDDLLQMGADIDLEDFQEVIPEPRQLSIYDYENPHHLANLAQARLGIVFNNPSAANRALDVAQNAMHDTRYNQAPAKYNSEDSIFYNECIEILRGK